MNFPLNIKRNHDRHQSKLCICHQNQIKALDAIDNMHLNLLWWDSEKKLKVKLTRNSFYNGNQKTKAGGFSNPNNRATWDDETWMKENSLKEDSKIGPESFW
ncbi:hypothetical protein PTTG_10207 [Puccinia triticina 1-1 BBBD Race 1]|uniref:Uncharacterized protein n=1 Tax=Puccinia triticina (isolate 1-1 / race 1 (BBBD)) TaxID=630390 RepID=A0A180G529_PUCT1|nr:hypothetical protein PTTG_10207 [Puccinia triticina 1-1 BBBD Race 1]